MAPENLTGGCACRAIRYRTISTPLIVHACHCRDCQRLTGSGFVINLWIERKFVETDHALLKSFRLDAGSGKPHDVFFCPDCGTYLWSRYHIVRGECLFVRAGTLDEPALVMPDVHLFTRDKLPWIRLPAGARAFETSYRIDELWSPESKERLKRNATAAT